MVLDLNDIYSGISCKQSWKQKAIENMLPLKNDYFKYTKKLVELKNFNNLLFSLLTLFVFNSKYGAKK